MRVRKLFLLALIVLALLGIIGYLRPDITGFVVRDLAITDVMVSAKEQVDVEFNIEQSKDSIEKLDKPIYYYLKIRDADFSGMNYFLVKFKVEKDWLRENGLKKSDIILYYLKSYWQKGETEFVNEDENYVYYEAETDVSSLFAIAVERVKPVIAEKKIKDRDLIYFAVLPLVFIGLIGLLGILFFVWIYRKVRYFWIARIINYYVVLFIVSSLIIIFSLGQLKVKDAAVSGSEVILYGIVPVLVLVLILVLILHGLIRLYKYSKLIRDVFWFMFDYGFVFVILIAVFYALPTREVAVGGADVLLFGILPLIILSFVILGLYRVALRLIERVWW